VAHLATRPRPCGDSTRYSISVIGEVSAATL